MKFGASNAPLRFNRVGLTMNKHENISLVNYSYVFKFESEFVFKESLDWMVKNWTYGFYYVVVYLLVIFGGKHLMQRKSPIDLRRLLIVWNLGLAFFSFMGALRTIPEFVHSISNNSFYYSICVSSFAELDRVSGFWTWLFTLSKVVELGDTLFIVLQKKNLIFLHWYHHITALLYVWYSYMEVPASARWFMVMNYSVHTLMYSYFALRAMRYNPPRQMAMLITSLQIGQMVMACVINMFALHLLNKDVPCKISYKNIAIASILYFTYFLLFAKFFFKSYMSSKTNAKKKLDINFNSISSSKTKVN